MDELSGSTRRMQLVVNDNVPNIIITAIKLCLIEIPQLVELVWLKNQ